MTDVIKSQESEHKSLSNVREASPPTLTLDYDRYQKYLDNSMLTDSQKQQFLNALWSIIVNFVDLGFGIHPVQQSCEQKPLESINVESNSINLIKRNNTTKRMTEVGREFNLPQEKVQND